MDTRPLCPAPAELRLARLVLLPDVITVITVARQASSLCPACGHRARRVHAWYTRTLADLPWHGLRVRLEVHARKFRCEVPRCRRRIFCERLPLTTRPYGRRTHRAETTLARIGLALGGRAGARLAQALGFLIGATALLARVRGAPTPAGPTPRVLGVDDWAIRRAERYGTVLVDLERHRVVDLLPDRTAETFAAWLHAHPGVEIISRDRGGPYAEGARRGAPRATQVADRFHLLRNLVDTLATAFERHPEALRRATAVVQQQRLHELPAHEGPATEPPSLATAPPTAATHTSPMSAERAARLRAAYARVHELHRAGTPIAVIARVTGVSRQRIRRYLRAPTFPAHVRPGPRRGPRVLTPWLAVLEQHWQAGCHRSLTLYQRLRAAGCPAARVTVWRWAVARRQADPAEGAAAWQAHPDVQQAAHVAHALRGTSLLGQTGPTLLRPPSPQQAAWLLLRTGDPPLGVTRGPALDATRFTAALGVVAPALAEAGALAREFRHLVRQQDGAALEAWLPLAQQSALRSFASGIARDHAAVAAAITSPWSNGQTEGQVTRLKLVKRSMYGRAGLPLLRARLLATA